MGTDTASVPCGRLKRTIKLHLGPPQGGSVTPVDPPHGLLVVLLLLLLLLGAC